MVTYKRKKVGKYRGGSSHGGGARKKRRGAGSRGGHGRAGSGKRAGHKKFGIVLGRRGFTSHHVSATVKAVNVSYFTPSRVNKLLQQGKAVKEGNAYSIDLSVLGYTKLLGTGKTSLKLKIKVKTCSPGAVEKIKAAGGDVVSSVVGEEAPSKETA